MEQTIIKNLAQRQKLPFYLFDADAFRNRIRRIQDNLPEGTLLAFAIKANPFLTETAASAVDRLEICSFGEYQICRKRGIAPEKMLISGVLKKEHEFLEILDFCGGDAIYTAESLRQYRILEQWASGHQTHVHVYPRITSGNQFGMDSESFWRLIEDHQSEYVHIDGIHYFSGTQKRSFDLIYPELENIFALAEETNRQFSTGIQTIEFGPGFRVDYFEKKGSFPDPMSVSPDEWRKLGALLQQKSSQFTVRLEMGRFMAASCGCYGTRILDTKVNQDVRYAIVDGGIHQLNYDGQIKGMYKPRVLHFSASEEHEKSGSAPEESPKPWTVCGSLCTVNDVLVKQLMLCDPDVGDYLIFQDTGAYSVTEGMALFLSHELPDVFLYSREDGLTTLRNACETYQWNTL